MTHCSHRQGVSWISGPKAADQAQRKNASPKAAEPACLQRLRSPESLEIKAPKFDGAILACLKETVGTASRTQQNRGGANCLGKDRVPIIIHAPIIRNYNIRRVAHRVAAALTPRMQLSPKK